MIAVPHLLEPGRTKFESHYKRENALDQHTVFDGDIMSSQQSDKNFIQQLGWYPSLNFLSGTNHCGTDDIS